jgi:hypothetical protein
LAEKKTISAKEILADIHAGATDAFLMKKYAISEKGLQSLFHKLIAAKVLTQADLHARATPLEKIREPEEIKREKPEEPKSSLTVQKIYIPGEPDQPRQDVTSAAVGRDATEKVDDELRPVESLKVDQTTKAKARE